MKIGRNEICPCGSGKKYKVCCGAAPETESPRILAWRRLSRAVQDHAPKLLSFVAESHGRRAIPEAWEEFTLWSGEPFDPGDGMQMREILAAGDLYVNETVSQSESIVWQFAPQNGGFAAPASESISAGVIISPAGMFAVH